MVRWNELGRAKVGSAELVLARRGDEFAIRLRRAELMNSRSHGSEDLLGKLGCAVLAKVGKARVLVGGLGMGFTARAVLDSVRPDAQVVIRELVPEVVAWNREYLGDLARRPLDDPRVTIETGDVKEAIVRPEGAWNAILLDVDNGPDAFTSPANAGAVRLPSQRTWLASAVSRTTCSAFVLLSPRGYESPPDPRRRHSVLCPRKDARVAFRDVSHDTLGVCALRAGCLASGRRPPARRFGRHSPSAMSCETGSSLSPSSWIPRLRPLARPRALSFDESNTVRNDRVRSFARRRLLHGRSSIALVIPRGYE